MVELNFDRARPPALLNLNEVPELRGWSRENGTLRLGAGLTYTEAMEPALAELLPALAEASRTVGSPQIRNRGTIGGNLGTASPAGDALPPLLVDGRRGRARERAWRRASLPLREFLVGPKRNALEPDELIAARPARADRRAADVHEGRAAERDGDRGRARSRSPSTASAASCARRSARPGRCRGSSTAPLDERDGFPERVAEAASPIDDVRGTAAYRRHALRVLTDARARAVPGVRIELTVNGERARGRRLGGREPALRAARAARPARLEERLRAGRVRLVLGAARRDARLRVPRARGAGGRPRGRDGRGARATTSELHRVQEAFVETGAVQCGFCTPGLVVATADLLERSPTPSDDEIREALSGNLCRCTGYAKIFDAVRLAAERVSTTAPHARARPRRRGRQARRRDAEGDGRVRLRERPLRRRDALGPHLRSPHAHARIVEIDISAGARACPACTPCSRTRTCPGEKRYGLEFPDQPVLAIDRVRYFGEPVALVAAEHPEQARRAAEPDRASSTSRSSPSSTWSARPSRRRSTPSGRRRARLPRRPAAERRPPRS